MSIITQFPRGMVLLCGLLVTVEGMQGAIRKPVDRSLRQKFLAEVKRGDVIHVAKDPNSCSVFSIECESPDCKKVFLDFDSQSKHNSGCIAHHVCSGRTGYTLTKLISKATKNAKGDLLPEAERKYELPKTEFEGPHGGPDGGFFQNEGDTVEVKFVNPEAEGHAAHVVCCGKCCEEPVKANPLYNGAQKCFSKFCRGEKTFYGGPRKDKHSNKCLSRYCQQRKKDYCIGTRCDCKGEWVRAIFLRPDYGVDAGSWYPRGLTGIRYIDTPETLEDELPFRELTGDHHYTDDFKGLCKWETDIHPVSKDRIRKEISKEHRAEFEEKIRKHKATVAELEYLNTHLEDRIESNRKLYKQERARKEYLEYAAAEKDRRIRRQQKRAAETKAKLRESEAAGAAKDAEITALLKRLAAAGLR